MKSVHLRLIRRAMAKLPVVITSIADHQGHYKVTVQHGERFKTFTMSGSPRSPEGFIKEAVRDVRRFIEGKYL